jgi:uncharacterized protein YbbK (DUF523 family)
VGACLSGSECGFGAPREAMRLVRVEQGLRLLTVKTGIDLTEQMARFSRSRVSALGPDNPSGYGLVRASLGTAGKHPSRDWCRRTAICAGRTA